MKSVKRPIFSKKVLNFAKTKAIPLKDVNAMGQSGLTLLKKYNLNSYENAIKLQNIYNEWSRMVNASQNENQEKMIYKWKEEQIKLFFESLGRAVPKDLESRNNAWWKKN